MVNRENPGDRRMSMDDAPESPDGGKAGNGEMKARPGVAAVADDTAENAIRLDEIETLLLELSSEFGTGDEPVAAP